MPDRKAVTYYPEKTIKEGHLSLLKEMVGEVINSRWLTWQLFRRNFNAMYQQSVLGIVWALIVPLVTVGIFIFLNRGGIFNVGDMEVPYPVFALAGTAFWQLFSVGLTIGIGSLVNAGTMITQIRFPRVSLIVSGAAQGFVPSLIQVGVVLIVLAAYKIVPPWTVLLVPFSMIPLVFLTIGLVFIFSLLNAVVRDIGNGIPIITTFLLFVTPVLYAKPSSGIVAEVSRYNPLFYLVSVPRDLFISGSTQEVVGFIYSSILSFVVFFLCWIAFRLAESKVVERI